MQPTRSLTAHCTLSHHPAGQPLLTVDNGYAKAEISLFGAHVLSYQRHGEPASIWLSDKAVLDGSKPIRGGIPSAGPGSARPLPASAAASPPMALPAPACGRWTVSPITETELWYTSLCVTTRQPVSSGLMPLSWSWTCWSAGAGPGTDHPQHRQSTARLQRRPAHLPADKFTGVSERQRPWRALCRQADRPEWPAAGPSDPERPAGSGLLAACGSRQHQDGERETRVVSGNHDSVVVWTPGWKAPAPWPT